MTHNRKRDLVIINYYILTAHPDAGFHTLLAISEIFYCKLNSIKRTILGGAEL